MHITQLTHDPICPMRPMQDDEGTLVNPVIDLSQGGIERAVAYLPPARLKDQQPWLDCIKAGDVVGIGQAIWWCGYGGGE